MTWERMLTGEADRGPALGDAYRPIRRLSAADAPVPGELAATGEATVVLADVTALGGWPGWAHGGSQHVYGVRDVVRRERGHDAVLPPCARLLREASDRPELAGGEAVTIAVSLLRGVHEVREVARGRGEPPPRGAWWLLTDGRPVFVPSLDPEAGDDGVTAAVGIVTVLAERLDDRVARRLLDEVSAALEDGTDGGLEQLEDRLFEAYAPRGLDRLLRDDVDRGEVAANPDAVPARTRRELRRGRDRTVRELGASGWGSVSEGPPDTRARRREALDLREIVDAALAGRVAEGVTTALARVRERVRTVSSLRGAPLILGGAAAAAVVAVGLMWPADEPASAEPGDVAVEGGGGPDDASSGSARPDPPRPDDARDAPPAPDQPVDDPVTAGELLLDGLAACAAADDVACGDVLAATAPAPDEGTAVLLPAEARTLALLDDYGDIAVIQVAPLDAVAGVIPQAVVLEHDGDDRWLIRDIHDLAPLESTIPDDEGAG